VIEAVYVAQVQEPLAQEVRTVEQKGLIHSKGADRYEVLKELPKEAHSFDTMFDYADFYGKLRLGYIDSRYDLPAGGDERKHAFSLGGELGFKTAEYNGVHLQGAVYVSQDVHALNPRNEKKNPEFFGEDLESYAYVGEMGLHFQNEYAKGALGRIRVETPYADSDDIRMSANSFEGACVFVEYMPNLSSQFLYLTRWAGYDSQDSEANLYQNKFKKLVDEESFGMASGSIIYEYAPESSARLWVNYIDRMSVITYVEASGIEYFGDEWIHFDYGVQYSRIGELEDSNVEGSVYGAMGIVHLNKFFFGAAANLVYVEGDNYVTDGFGGGPYYTSLDEATLACMSQLHPGEDLRSYKVGIGYDFSETFFEGLVAELVYGELRDDHNKAYEENLIITYDLNERWHLEAIATHFEPTRLNQGFDRAVVRLDYNF
jgi:hypothetical protein